MPSIRRAVERVPLVGDALVDLYWRFIGSQKRPKSFSGSTSYWERRYAAGGRSGAGSYNQLATFKADVLNRFVKDNDIQSVIEFGCGDGNQLALSDYPRYLGFDVSETAISICRRRFANDSSKEFILVKDYADQKADLSLSLDVIYHLIEDGLFEAYMLRLFESSNRFVAVYSSNSDDLGDTAPHVRHRNFTRWIDTNLKDWVLDRYIPNDYPYKGDFNTGTFADFYIYRRSPLNAVPD